MRILSTDEMLHVAGGQSAPPGGSTTTTTTSGGSSDTHSVTVGLQVGTDGGISGVGIRYTYTGGRSAGTGSSGSVGGATTDSGNGIVYMDVEEINRPTTGNQNQAVSDELEGLY